MQSFDTKQTFIVGRIDDLRSGACISFELPDGNELAVYNVNGEYYATENSCPYRVTIEDQFINIHLAAD